MKVAMYVGLFDDTCPLVKAEEQRQTMGETVAHYVVAPWQGHVPWGFSAAPWFINDLVSSLMINADMPDDASFVQ